MYNATVELIRVVLIRMTNIYYVYVIYIKSKINALEIFQQQSKILSTKQSRLPYFIKIYERGNNLMSRLRSSVHRDIGGEIGDSPGKPRRMATIFVVQSNNMSFWY